MGLVKLKEVVIEAKEFQRIENDLEKNSKAKEIIDSLFTQLSRSGVDISLVDKDALWANDFNDVFITMDGMSQRYRIIVRKVIK